MSNGSYRKQPGGIVSEETRSMQSNDQPDPDLQAGLARPEWQRPVTTLMDIEEATLSHTGNDGDSCDSKHS
jgi:hypothetical protein